jgi:type I restriction enzyme S subunit
MRAAQPHLNAEELGNCIILIPPKPEQEEVVSYFNKETANLDKILAKIDKSTASLREYRTALISAAVTGKIDLHEEIS